MRKLRECVCVCVCGTTYDPVARRVPSEFHSRDVTSFASSPCGAVWCSTIEVPFLKLSLSVDQIRAVESLDPEASRSNAGFHAHANTSLSCPRRIVAWSGADEPSSFAPPVVVVAACASCFSLSRLRSRALRFSHTSGCADSMSVSASIWSSSSRSAGRPSCAAVEA
jgi:hypothetical protein